MKLNEVLVDISKNTIWLLYLVILNVHRLSGMTFILEYQIMYLTLC